MASIKVYVKKQARVDRLNFGQKKMLTLGTVALAARKSSIVAAKNAFDQPAKPLTKRYAIFKSKLRRGGGRGTNKRDLTLTGDLLRSWQVRTVSEDRAAASWTVLKKREKARNNQRHEIFVAFSPSNVSSVVRAAETVLKEMVGRLIFIRNLTR